MPSPAHRRWARSGPAEPVAPDRLDAGIIDETVVHDPGGRPWLVCTVDTRCERRPPGEYTRDEPEPSRLDDARRSGPYETQVFYTARAGIRGLPTGHGEHFATREAAVAGHRRWCLKVRTGQVLPDLVPTDPL